MKRIDTNKSLIFDKKINNLKVALEFIGKEGYFSNNDFSVYIKGTLKSVLVSDKVDYPYTNKYDNHGFDYFIPKDSAVFTEEPKKKNYRPFMYLDELPFNIGDVVIYRCKQCCSECKGIVTEIEYQNDDTCELDNIIIGGINGTPQELFDHYELLDDNCQYRPFGVEE